jgi:hypothetical protein
MTRCNFERQLKYRYAAPTPEDIWSGGKRRAELMATGEVPQGCELINSLGWPTVEEKLAA